MQFNNNNFNNKKLDINYKNIDEYKNNLNNVFIKYKEKINEDEYRDTYNEFINEEEVKSDQDETKTLLKRMASPGLDKSDMSMINNLNFNS